MRRICVLLLLLAVSTRADDPESRQTELKAGNIRQVVIQGNTAFWKLISKETIDKIAKILSKYQPQSEERNEETGKAEREGSTDPFTDTNDWQTEEPFLRFNPLPFDENNENLMPESAGHSGDPNNNDNFVPGNSNQPESENMPGSSEQPENQDNNANFMTDINGAPENQENNADILTALITGNNNGGPFIFGGPSGSNDQPENNANIASHESQESNAEIPDGLIIGSNTGGPFMFNEPSNMFRSPNDLHRGGVYW